MIHEHIPLPINAPTIYRVALPLYPNAGFQTGEPPTDHILCYAVYERSHLRASEREMLYLFRGVVFEQNPSATHGVHAALGYINEAIHEATREWMPSNQIADTLGQAVAILKSLGADG